MTRHTTLSFILLVCAALIAACVSQTAPSARVTWSPAQKAEGAKIIASIREANEATKLSSGGVAFTQPSKAEIDSIQAHRKRAIELGQAVSEDVVRMADPDLPDHFRNEFLLGLEKRTRALDVGNTMLEIEGSALLDLWADWYDANAPNIRIPR